jgi:hypothetical protein
MMMEMWNTLSKEQKLKFVEANHAQRQKEFQARWDSMSADEKIAKFEQHMAKRGGGAGGKRSGGGEGGMGGKQREGGPMGGGIERPHAPQSPEMP